MTTEVIPPEYILTPGEDKLMDLIVAHFIDFYFENPIRFVKPVLQKLSDKNTTRYIER